MVGGNVLYGSLLRQLLRLATLQRFGRAGLQHQRTDLANHDIGHGIELMHARPLHLVSGSCSDGTIPDELAARGGRQRIIIVAVCQSMRGRVT
jgi:hypothetical protein